MIGIAFCAALRDEGSGLTRLLMKNGFDVVCVPFVVRATEFGLSFWLGQPFTSKPASGKKNASSQRDFHEGTITSL